MAAGIFYYFLSITAKVWATENWQEADEWVDLYNRRHVTIPAGSVPWRNSYSKPSYAADVAVFLSSFFFFFFLICQWALLATPAVRSDAGFSQLYISALYVYPGLCNTTWNNQSLRAGLLTSLDQANAQIGRERCVSTQLGLASDHRARVHLIGWRQPTTLIAAPITAPPDWRNFTAATGCNNNNNNN